MNNLILKLLLLSFCKVSIIWTLRTTDGHNLDQFFTEEKNCFDKFVPQLKSMADEAKNDSLTCLNIDDLRTQINEKVKLIQELMTKCTTKLNTKDYFYCVKETAVDTQRILKEIPSLKEQIQQKKTVCLTDASKRGKHKMTNALFDLNLCLKITSIQPKEPIDMEKFLKKIDLVKENYNRLKACTLPFGYTKCWRRPINDFNTYVTDEGKNLNEYLKDHLLNNSNYFWRITEIDYADDSCIRQYIAMNINKAFQFDLRSCLISGRRAIEEGEENSVEDEILKQDLIKLHKEFDQCRDIPENCESIADCVENILERSSELKLTLKSEVNFEIFKETLQSSYIDEYPCIGDLCDALQFNRINFSKMKQDALISCLTRGYKQTQALTFKEQLINELSQIQEYLKKCTRKYDSPGYNCCFLNIFKVYDSSIEFLKDKNVNYVEIVVEYDRNNNSCFENIAADFSRFSDDFEDVDFSQSENCVDTLCCNS